jgi:hypothetical protein
LGIGDQENRRYTTFTDNVVMPFVDTWHKIVGLPDTVRRLVAAKD